MIDPAPGQGVSRPPLVVGIDGSVASHVALEWACAEAARRGLRVQLVTAYFGIGSVYPDYTAIVGDQTEDARLLAESLVAGELSWARSQWPDVRFTAQAVNGEPARVLRASAAGAESLVIGTSHVHPAGVSLLSSLADTLVSKTAAPVVVVAESLAPRTDGPVVVGVTTNSHAEAVLRFGFRHAGEHGTSVRAIAYLPEQRRSGARVALGDRHLAEAWLFDQLAVWRARYPGVAASGVVIENNPAVAVLAESTNARLLVLARKRRRSVSAIWNAEGSMLPHGCRPVAVIPAR